MEIEQYIYTSNPEAGGAFQHFASLVNDKKTCHEIITILSCANDPGKYDNNTKQYDRLKEEIRNEERIVAQKKTLFGTKYIKEMVPYVYKNKIAIVSESMQGPLAKRDVDYRDNPENAPYRIIKTKLIDGRVLCARVACIGRVYSEQDTREGNMFWHAIILPEGVDLTDEEIKKIKFQKGLNYKAIISGKEKMLPKMLPKIENKDDLFEKKLSKKDFKSIFSIAETIQNFQNEYDELGLKTQLTATEEDRYKKIPQYLDVNDNKLKIEMAKVNPKDVLEVVKSEINLLENSIKSQCEREKREYNISLLYNDEEYKILKIVKSQASADLKYMAQNQQNYSYKQ